MAVTIYHNPRCSKSRQALQLITDSGSDHTVVLYLDTPPNGASIVDLASKLGMAVAEMLRPIVVDDDSGKAVIGRPPENVLELLS